MHRVRPHVLHLMRGQIFELDGYRFFTMGGAKSHDIEDGILEPDAPDFEQRLMTLRRKPRARYRVNHISWWAQELPPMRNTPSAAKARRGRLAGGLHHHPLRSHQHRPHGEPPQRGGPAHRLPARGTGKSKIPLLAVRPLPRQPSH